MRLTASSLRRAWGVVAASAALALAASGCSAPSSSSAEGDASSETGSSADAAGFPTTIDTALGSVTIESQPKRVVAIGWGSQDVALALGVTPVGMQDQTGDSGDDSGLMPWTKEKVGDAEPELIKYQGGELPLEQIANLDPDVILAVNSGLTQQQFDQLTEVAPTVAYPGKPWLTSWKDQTTMVGQALGKSDEAKALITDTDALIAKAKKDHPEFAGKTVAFGSGTEAGSYNVYLASDSRVKLLEQLGFTISPSTPTEAESFAAKVSLERLPDVRSDVLVAWYLSDSVKSELEKSSLFAEVPAVKNGGYVPLTDPSLVFATSSVTVLSLPWMLDQYLPLLSSAAKGQQPKI